MLTSFSAFQFFSVSAFTAIGIFILFHYKIAQEHDKSVVPP
jgi:hypothetical protein